MNFVKPHKWLVESKELFILIGKSFFRSPRGPLFLYIVPTFFTVLFYYLMSSLYPDPYDKASLLFGYMLIPTLTIITSLAPAIVEWKNSVFLKRIDTTGIKKSMFILSMYLFYLLIGFSGVLLQLIIAILIGGNDFISILKNINVGYFILGVTLLILMCIGISALVGGIGNKEGTIQGIVMMIYFTSLFLSGIMLPVYMVEASQALRIITYFVFTKYPTFVILFAIRGGTWDFNTSSTSIQTDFTHIYQPIIASIGIVILLFTITKFTFKWSANK